MTESIRTGAGLIIAAVIAFFPGSALGLELKPYKDRLFAYPATLAQEKDGRYRILDYNEMRDINGRDEIPERRAHSSYVSLKVRRAQVEIESGELRWVAVGNRESPALITLYVHGQGGDRRQGVNDFTFGGNFNRIKNLMAGNNGLYLSPDVSGFDAVGAAGIAAILRHYHRRTAAAPVFVACGSMGAMICYHLAQDAEMAGIIAGFILLGAPPDTSLLTSRAFKARTPIFLGHGSADRVYPISSVEAFFGQIETRSPGYPVKLYRFETGSHGTPIRMIDWRETLNWMLGSP